MKHLNSLQLRVNLAKVAVTCIVVTNDTTCTRGIKCSIAIPKAAVNKRKAFVISKLDLKLRERERGGGGTCVFLYLEHGVVRC
jgi:hypothetical protein